MTLKEIKAYDWTVAIMKSAFTHPDEAKRVNETGLRPDVSAKWAHSSMGWVEVDWQEEASEAAKEFLKLVVPKLEEIAQMHGLTEEEVRIVFWFDS